MSSQPDQYGIESDDEPTGSSSEPGAFGAPDPSLKPIGFQGSSAPPPSPPARGIPITSRRDDGPAHAPVKDLDVCPNCGASMRGAETLVCLRCGFDLKTMKVVQTVTGETTAPAGEADQGPPLVQPGMGDLWLPGAMAAIGGGFLVVCYLAGVSSLYPAPAGQAAAEIDLATRFSAVLRFIVLVTMGSACGLGALAFLASLLGMKLVRDLADLKIAAVRMLGIVVTARLAALVNFASPAWEWTAESLAQLAAFAGLSIMLFKLNPRDALTLTGATVILFVLLWLFAHLVVWVTTAA